MNPIDNFVSKVCSQSNNGAKSGKAGSQSWQVVEAKKKVEISSIFGVEKDGTGGELVKLLDTMR